MSSPYLIVTSIAAPNEALRQIAADAKRAGYVFLVIGDRKSPENFSLADCEFYSVKRQQETGFRYAEICPTGHYARKNIGYLLAIKAGAPLILETDDDNFPLAEFWLKRKLHANAATIKGAGWLNVYRYFSDVLIWPRGFPLEWVRSDVRDFDSLPKQRHQCPIQQGLADDNPDVDAVYRLLLPLPQTFRRDRRVILSDGSWSPFNSQNTAWWPQAYALLYLPAYCSFRMTDIWRSFVAQKISWTNDWSILFHEPNVVQQRNEHDLMRDFVEEIPGYVNNRAICSALDQLELGAGAEALCDNLILCYRRLIEGGWIGEKELALIEAWVDDIKASQEKIVS